MTAPRPCALVAELTYRCALRCGYCSNPLDRTKRHDALRTDDWTCVLTEAEALGVMQVTLTGGEPLLRDDLETIVAHGRRLELYQTLITSGLPLTRNAVLHRANLDHMPEIVALAEDRDAERLEPARTRYLGRALANRKSLLPDRAQIGRASATAAEARARLEGRMEMLFVLPDYFTGKPKACMGGWAQRLIVVGPVGTALPCHGAHALPLPWGNVRDRELGAI